MNNTCKALSIAYLLFITQIAIAQNQNPLNLKVGEFIFYQVYKPRHVTPKSAADVKRYYIETPLYLIGKIISFQGSLAEIEAHTFLYTCSMTSTKWIRTSTIELEKYSGEKVETEIWSINDLPKYKKRLYYLHPYNEESLLSLTKNNIIETTESCKKIIAIDVLKK